MNEWRGWAGGVLGALLFVNAWGSEPAVRVQFDSLDAPQGQAVLLDGWWYRPPAPLSSDTPGALRPAVLMLHGCSGMLDRQGQPSARMREMAARLNAEGWHALAVDSLGPRGEKELCTQRIGQRKITQTERRRDALAALRWLAQQPGVDPGRVAVLGWSHGGSTALAASNRAHPEVAQASVLPRFVAAYYPGCEAERFRGYVPVADTLLLVGLADDWTPAAPCQALAPGNSRVTVLAYEGAYHGFDGTAPLRHLAQVPNGVNPGQGVHVGAHPEAREASQRVLLDALRQAFQGSTGD